MGIDGGGTKTRCALANETTVLASAMTGGSNLVRLGEAQAREALQGAIHQVCSTANIVPDKIHAVCIGAAGAARPNIAAKIQGLLAELLPGIGPANVEVVGDTEIAHEAAFGEGPGVIVIAGTGSVAYGRTANGRIARAGGWGFAISDEGSGHWIGRRAVSSIVAAHDEGDDGGGVLRALVFGAWKLDSLDQLVERANFSPPPDFPRLFPLVLKAAEAGDARAQELLAEAGGKLASLATAVLRRLASSLAGNSLPVAMTGSVFRQSSEVRQVFYNILRANFPGIELRTDPVDPVAGALARARRK